MTGKKHSLETRLKMRQAALGRKHTEEAKKKISLNSRAVKGPAHYEWKGEDVSYRNLHRWVERWLGKAKKCVKDLTHISTRYHWANISGEYKRDLSDWRELCPSCNLRERRVAP